MIASVLLGEIKSATQECDYRVNGVKTAFKVNMNTRVHTVCEPTSPLHDSRLSVMGKRLPRLLGDKRNVGGQLSENSTRGYFESFIIIIITKKLKLLHSGFYLAQFIIVYHPSTKIATAILTTSLSSISVSYTDFKRQNGNYISMIVIYFNVAPLDSK